MGNQLRTRIFISHASEDRILAKKIKQLFLNSLKKLKSDEIFCSSDKKSIKMYAHPFQKITQALQSAKVVLALMTPNSIYRPWV